MGESLWLDELHTGWVVKDSWNEVAWRAQIGNQSPLWFYAVKTVTTLLGESEFSLRLLSLVAGTALIPAAYLLLRNSTRVHEEIIHPACDLAGLLVAALVAIDRNCIFYATEARPYACLQLAAAVQLGLFLRNLRQPTTLTRLGCILLSGLIFHLHYTGLLVLLGELVGLAVYYAFSRNKVPYRPWRSLFDAQVVVMLCLPALPHVLQVGSRREMWKLMSEQPQWSELGNQLWNLFPLQGVPIVATIVLAVVLIRRLSRKDAATTSWSWTPLVITGLWFAIPILAAWLIAHFDFAQVFMRRYLMAVAIGPMLLAGLLLLRIQWRWLQFAAVAVVLSFALYDSQIVEQFRYDGRAVGDRNEDWRGALAWLREQHPSKPWPVALDSGLIEDHPHSPLLDMSRDEDKLARLDAYLAFATNSLYPCPSAEVQRLNSRNPGCKWMVVRGEGGVRCLWEQLTSRLVATHHFGSIHVMEFEPLSADANQR